MNPDQEKHPVPNQMGNPKVHPNPFLLHAFVLDRRYYPPTNRTNSIASVA